MQYGVTVVGTSKWEVHGTSMLCVATPETAAVPQQPAGGVVAEGNVQSDTQLRGVQAELVF
jgi:hypothetical protein